MLINIKPNDCVSYLHIGHEREFMLVSGCSSNTTECYFDDRQIPALFTKLTSLLRNHEKEYKND